ncbi:MAG TPA: arginase family protein, partial [Bacteroidales bacterium]|nr:arginase family protein [Bacteroidales bacterium]
MKLFPDYFDPVSLDKPLLEFLPRDYTFSANIKVHTAGTKTCEPADYRVALVGIPEGRNSPASGFALAPDKVREALYQTARIPRNIKIVDLGNIKSGQTVNDTYAALTDVATDLLQKNLTIVVLGGSQDLTIPLFRAYKKLHRTCSLLVIDNRPDLLPSPD